METLCVAESSLREAVQKLFVLTESQKSVIDIAEISILDKTRLFSQSQCSLSIHNVISPISIGCK